ncbi:MAG: transketolase [Ignavibacteriales bacterium]|nr:transketolase [Ignavibacteriales bacterium]
MNYEEKILELCLKDKRVNVLTAENRASIRNLPNIIKDQFIDTGINEQSLVGISSGLALRGRIPIVHALAAFLTMRAFEFIRTDIGYPNLNVKLVGNFAGFLSEANGPTHQAIEDISLMRAIPNMNIFCPADIDDLLKALPTIINYNKPFYIRYNDLPAVVEHEEFALGKAEVFGNNGEAVVFVYGTLFGETYKAKSILEKEGIQIKLVNLRTIKPIDDIEIIRSLKLCKTVITIEDHYKNGGLNSIISEIATQEKMIIDLLSLSLGNNFFMPARFKDVLTYEGFNATQIAKRIKEFIKEKERKFNVEWSNV